jgi:hypothetical protein
MPNVPATSPPAYCTLSEIARRFPPSRADRPVHPQTLKRWITEGIRLSNGQRVRLHAVRFPIGWRTTDAWVDQFLEALTSDRVGSAKPTATSEARARQAGAVLQANGW